MLGSIARLDQINESEHFWTCITEYNVFGEKQCYL